MLYMKLVFSSSCDKLCLVVLVKLITLLYSCSEMPPDEPRVVRRGFVCV